MKATPRVVSQKETAVRSIAERIAAAQGTPFSEDKIEILRGLCAELGLYVENMSYTIGDFGDYSPTLDVTFRIR